MWGRCWEGVGRALAGDILSLSIFWRCVVSVMLVSVSVVLYCYKTGTET